MTRPLEHLHHGNHDTLADQVRTAPPGGAVDAIIVPSARPPEYVDHAAELADKLDCNLLVLCSQRSSAAGVKDRAPAERVAAIDVAGLEHLLPSFGTCAIVAGTPFERSTDTSMKRNLGLLVARAAGWQKVAFLDDDIEVPQPEDLHDAAGLLGRYDAVGLANTGFPDNSVVCHAYRDTGGAQGTFVGGGALVVAPARTFSFFPNIYNEDWFFLLNPARIGSVGVHGEVVQEPFDPFASPARAEAEEFGDALAEGVFWLLDNGGRISQADRRHWASFLDRRRAFIDQITVRVIGSSTIGRQRKARMFAALGAARDRLAEITPELCIDYLRAWQRDRRQWCSFVGSFVHNDFLTSSARANWRTPQHHFRGV